MNTRHLEEFLLFAQELNWSTTAEKLFVTRPTLVDHIRCLEAELECKLVVSDQHQPALTPAGRRFVQTAHDLTSSWEHIRAEYRDLADNLLTVTIAASNLPWLETILYRARRTIHESCPYKRVEVVADAGAFASIDALYEHANDIVVVGYKSHILEQGALQLPDDLCGFLLDTEEIRLLMTPENPLFDRKEVFARDLDGATFMLPPDIHRSWTRDAMTQRFAASGARVTLVTSGFSDHAEYFAHDFGHNLGIVPTTLIPRYGIDAREEYRAFSLADLPIESSFYAVFKRDFVQSENGSLLFREMQRAAKMRTR